MIFSFIMVSMKKEIQGAVTEHWLDKRLRLNKAVNDPTNLIRIKAKDLLTLHNHKQDLLGTRRSLLEESEEAERRRLESLPE